MKSLVEIELKKAKDDAWSAYWLAAGGAEYSAYSAWLVVSRSAAASSAIYIAHSVLWGLGNKQEEIKEQIKLIIELLPNEMRSEAT